MPGVRPNESVIEATERKPCAACGTPIPGIVVKVDPMAIDGKQQPAPGSVVFSCYKCGHSRTEPPVGAMPDVLKE